MQPLKFDGLRRILCVGAHSDDIEIGCGATLLRLTEERPDLEIMWVVFSAPDERADEARSSARDFLRRAKKADILKSIREKKDISKDGIEDKLKAALDEFGATFAA